MTGIASADRRLRRVALERIEPVALTLERIGREFDATRSGITHHLPHDRLSTDVQPTGTFEERLAITPPLLERRNPHHVRAARAPLPHADQHRRGSDLEKRTDML